MIHRNLDIIDKFFEAYSRHDIVDIEKVMFKNIRWIYPGKNPFSGTIIGIENLISFFDRMGSLMGKSNVKVEKLVMGANDDYVLECQYIRTHREDGGNLDQQMCVLWTFEGGKIIEGKHFTGDQDGLDSFFNQV